MFTSSCHCARWANNSEIPGVHAASGKGNLRSQRVIAAIMDALPYSKDFYNNSFAENINKNNESNIHSHTDSCSIPDDP